MDEGHLDIEAVSFDLDNTLCRYERSSAELLSLAFDTVDVDPLFGVEDYVATFDELAVRVDDMPTLRRQAFEQLAVDAGASADTGRAIARAYTGQRDPSRVTWREGMATAFEAIADAYPVTIVTNGFPAAQDAKLDRLGITETVDAVVYGDQVRKPSVEPFVQALAAVKTSPSRALHVGDSLEHDVAGANRAGLVSVWYPHEQPVDDPATGPVPDWIIESGADLLELART